MTRKLTLTLVILLVVLPGSAVWMKAQTQTQTYTCAAGFGEEMLPPVLLASLETVPNPVIPKDPAS